MNFLEFLRPDKYMYSSKLRTRCVGINIATIVGDNLDQSCDSLPKKAYRGDKEQRFILTSKMVIFNMPLLLQQISTQGHMLIFQISVLVANV